MEFLLKLLPSLVVCVGGGWWTVFISRKGIIEWYLSLTKPLGTPPDIVFPIVWTTMYPLMAIAVTLLWESDNRPKHTAFLRGAQIVLNFAWSWLPFNLRRMDLMALLDIAATFLWEKYDSRHSKQTAFLWFAAQLALNFAWSWLFFYLRRIDLALLDIPVLLFFIYRTYLSFSAHTLWGSYLLMAYLVLVSYAWYLNFFIWFYN